MNTHKIALFSAVMLLALAFAIPTASQGDQIIVNNADEVREDSVSITQDLVDLVAGVGPRIVLQYANELRFVGLVAVPSALQTKLDQVFARVVIEYANTVRHDDLAAIPSALEMLVGQVSDRIVLQYANSNRKLPLVYPTAFFNDITSPQITGVSATDVTTNTATIAWTTDEFADSLVQYGLQSGSYTETVQDSLYVKDHAIALSGLSSETTYYFKISSTDQSANLASSTEHSFSTPSPAPPEFPVYLPLILRNR